MSTGQYDPTAALTYLHYSMAAYCSESSISNWTCADCKQADTKFKTAQVFTDKKTSTQAFVGTAQDGDTDNIIVAFRGTQDLRNWITNLNFPKSKEYAKCHGCRVHEGFYDAWRSVSTPLLNRVAQLYLAKPNSKIHITGHSLGAALAVLCAAEIGAENRSLGLNVTGVYTYGEPRVGNKAFQEFYNSGAHVSWRLTHWKDPVPHLPLEGMGFHHISTEVFY